MTSFSNGRQAEDRASEYLRHLGYQILSQNWRTRFCEIDIVAQKDKTVYFVEVKYRRSNSQGSGLEYITPRKLKQMTFAAEMWVSENKWIHDYTLAAIEVSGAEFEVGELILDCSL